MRGDDWTSQKYFMEYFNGDVFPKFVLYSAHAETVHPLVQALGFKTVAEVPAASALFVEFFTTGMDDYEQKVRLLFKPNPQDEVTLLEGDLSLDEFQTTVQGIIQEWKEMEEQRGALRGSEVEQWCTEEYTHIEDYTSCFLWQYDYFKFFGLLEPTSQNQIGDLKTSLMRNRELLNY